MKYTGPLYAKSGRKTVQLEQTAADVDELADACRELIAKCVVREADYYYKGSQRVVGILSMPKESDVLRAYDILKKFPQ